MVALGGARQIPRSKLEVAMKIMDRVEAIVYVLQYGYVKMTPEEVSNYLASFYKDGRMMRSYPDMHELSRKCFFFAKPSV
jgi:hypothetical protein